MSKSRFCRTKTYLFALCVLFGAFSGSAHAAPQRTFYQVLDELLNDFETDIRNRQVTGLQDVAIRNITLSNNLQKSFQQRLELLVSEKIYRSSPQTRVVHCVVCRSGAPASQVDSFARMNKIKNFMDLEFTYLGSSMQLDFKIYDLENSMMVWTRTYEPKPVVVAVVAPKPVQKVAKKKDGDESVADSSEEAPAAEQPVERKFSIQYMPLIYGISAPKKDGGSSFVPALALRAFKGYGRDGKEWALELESYLGKTVFPKTNFTLVLMHSWVKFGGLIHAGLGGTYSKDFTGGVIRTGYDYKLSRSFRISTLLGYRPKVSNQGGVEFGAGIGYSF